MLHNAAAIDHCPPKATAKAWAKKVTDKRTPGD
jgi:hypothetical protein